MSSFVSIIIPCYNQGKFLSEAIQSAIDQDYQDKEVIVVNDGLTDSTQQAAVHFLQKIQYIEQENRGGLVCTQYGNQDCKGFLHCVL